MITFQNQINQPTLALTEQALKDMLENPVNKELINNYREMKYKMAEAEARQTVEDFVNAVIETQGYIEWLKSELTKDAKRRKKRIPASDLERVKMYIGQQKSSLPAVIPTVTHFDESTDRWGRTGMWRVQQNGYLSGLAVVDADHVPNPEALIDEWLQRENFKDLGIVWIFITPSGEGIKVVFKAREEWGNLQDNAYTMAEALGVLDFADSQTKNSDHAHFVPRAEDVKFVDWEGLLTYENPAYEARYGEAYRRGESEPTQPRWQELERQRKEARKGKAGDAAPKSAPVVANQPVELTERDMAIIKVLNEHYGETVAEGRRHETWLGETAPWLLLLTDNNAQKALAMGRELNYVKNWTDQAPDELENCIATVQKKPLLRRRPKALAELLEKAGIDQGEPVTATKNTDPMAALPFERWCDEIEALFTEYPCLREVCEPHPRRLWPFLLFASAAMMGTCMTLTYYRFYADRTKKFRLNYIILGVGDPASGKGTLSRLQDLLLAPIIDADQLADEATNNWKEMKGNAGDKETRARDKIFNRMFGPRTSNGEFIRSMINHVTEVEGELMHNHLVTVDSEKDNSINMSKSGGWQNRDIMVLKSFHNEWDSQHYTNNQSVSGRFRVYWNQIETCTPPTLKRLVNERNFNSGLDTRMATIPMGKPDFEMMPLMNESCDFEEANATLRQWAYKLDQRRGELPLWPLVEHVHKWCDERCAIADFNDKDQADWLLVKRVPYYGINISAPFIDMRHWEEREQTGTYEIDDTDRRLCDLVLDIQYRTQLFWYYDLHRQYYDDQLREAAQQRRRTNKFVECFRLLPEEFTTEKFAQVFGYANNRSGQKTLERLIEDKAIDRTMRGNYIKLVSEL